MSQYSKIFQKAPVSIQNYSGFDMSHINIGSMKVGTLVPVLTEPLNPADKISVGFNCNFQLPPMATDFIGKVDVKFEAFFVPYRILWQGWQKFYNNLNVDQYASPVTHLPKAGFYCFGTASSGSEFADGLIGSAVLGPGSLADYLGYKFRTDNLSDCEGYFEFKNVLPFLAYHMIYDRWYRDKVIQRPLFATPDEIYNMISQPSGPNAPFSGYDKDQFSAAMMPYTFGPDGINSIYMNTFHNVVFDEESGEETEYAGSDDFLFADGSNLFQLRQRNWAKDYFTVATPLPQAGNPVSVVFDVANGHGSFSIASIREANSLQKFKESRNLAGSEYDQIIFSEYGVKPADSVVQHPILLGAQTVNIYNRTVMQTANGGGESPESGYRNPFTETVGASYGKSSALGSGSIIDHFQAKEHGIIMILASIVPHAFYSSGTRRYLTYNDFSDFPNPKLVAVGDQPIRVDEIANSVYPGSDNSAWTFGYSQRYCEKKFHNDEVHGLLRDGESLQYFTIQRSFENIDESQNPIQISSDFLKIKTDSMDNVTAVASALSNYGAWYEIAFKEHLVSAFPEYSIPTLGDEKHTHTVMIDKGGKRL